VRENVLFGPQLEGREVDPERPVELAGLDRSFLDRDASRLSVGEQQRVMLARTLALEPEVLLLDEPTASLDPAQRERLWADVLTLPERGGAVCFVTQHHDELERADRVLELRDGRLVA
jgi:ABC-type multidrug transport system ATPase subunit